MKAFKFCLLYLVVLLLACEKEEKTGICSGCCDTNNSKICEMDFTESQCKDYISRREGGYDWVFFEGWTICPPNDPN
jgi:hypothetical protein